MNEQRAKSKEQGAKSMASKILRLNNFTGGEAAIFPVGAMPPKFSMKMQNCHISPRGGIINLPGYAKVNTTPLSGVMLQSGSEFRKSDGSVQLLCAGGGNIYKVDGNSLTAIKTGLDASAKVSLGAAMNDIKIMCNGVNPMMKYDGTTVSNLGGTPPATGFKAHIHKGRVWIIERANKLLATYSALNNPEDYTTANNAGYFDFRFVIGEGDELLDIFTYIDLLVFVFRNNILIYSGTNPNASGNFQLVQRISNTGAVASDVMQMLGTDCVFLSASGVKSLKQIVTTGSLNMGDISNLIDPTLLQEMASASRFASVHYPIKSWYMLLIGNTVWIYSYIYKAWARMTDADVKGMFGTADGKVYFCGTNYLYQYGIGNTWDGVNYKMEWELAWVSLSKAGLKCYPKMMELIAYPTNDDSISLDIEYDLNNVTAENVRSFNVQPSNFVYIDSVTDWDALTQIDEIQYQQIRMPLYGGGRIMKMKFTKTSDKQIELNDIVVLLDQGGF